MSVKSLAEVDPSTNQLKNGVKLPSAQIADATTVGKSLLTAADAPTARTALGATTVGAQLLTATDAATARGALGAMAKPATPSATQMLVMDSTGAVATQAIPTGGSSNTVTYVSGTGWPARPSTSDPVWWIDPTGTAPTPTGMLTGDFYPSVQGATTSGTAREILSTAQAGLTSGWYTQGGTETIDTTNGIVTLNAATDKVGAAPVTVTAGKTYRFTLWPASGNTGNITMNLVFHGTSDTYCYPGDAANKALVPSTGSITLTEVAPAGATTASLYIMTNGSGTLPAKVGHASLIES